jgi:hypothetical protein
MSVEGSLDLFKLPEILQIVAQQGKTGILTVQGESDIVAVSFLNGHVVGVDSLNQTGEEMFLAILEREDMVTADQVAELRQTAGGSSAEIRGAALRRGWLSRAQALEALRGQYCELLEGLLAWTEGEFKFYANDEVSFEEGLRPIDVQTLLLRTLPAAEESVEDSFPSLSLVEDVEEAPGPDLPPLEGLDLVYERLPSALPVRVRTPDSQDREESGFLLLTPTEQQVLSRVDGMRSIGDLMEDCALDWRSTATTIESLESMGLVRERAEAAVTGLQEEVFKPPDEILQLPQREAEEVDHAPRRRRLEADRVLALILPVVAFAMLGVLLIAVWRSPEAVLLPFPWQKELRQGFVEQQRLAQHLKIDQAAKTHFLLQGQFPDRLDELARSHLLSRRDLQDVRGLPFAYRREENRYELAVVGLNGPDPGLGTSEAITGSFLLDVDFFSLDPTISDRPLVLLD